MRRRQGVLGQQVFYLGVAPDKTPLRQV